ncbi:reverse transcriptase domain-containing protein [Tanacetum coccineum]
MDIEDHPIVICVKIGGHDIHRMYVDGGSALEILHEHCFMRLRPKVRRNLVSVIVSLIGFLGEISWPLGQMLLRASLEKYPYQSTIWMNFLVTRSPSQYNGILGRSRIRAMGAVLSTVHGMMKFLITLKSTKMEEDERIRRKREENDFQRFFDK